MDISTARETEVDLRDVGQKTLRNGRISQLQTVLGLRKTQELGGDWWSRLWSPTFRNEDRPRQGKIQIAFHSPSFFKLYILVLST